MTVTVRRVDYETAAEDGFAVRRAVFVREQGVDESEEMDGRDEAATHFVAYDDGDPVGTARLRTVGDGVGKVERVAVLAAHRGSGVGRALMGRLEAWAREAGFDRLKLHAQTGVEGFYEGLGYGTTGGVFVEAGIDHVPMEKALDDAEPRPSDSG